MPNVFPARKHLVKQYYSNVIFSQAMVTWKEKIPEPPHRFGLSVIWSLHPIHATPMGDTRWKCTKLRGHHPLNYVL